MKRFEKVKFLFLLSIAAIAVSGMTRVTQIEEWKAPFSADTLRNPLAKTENQLKGGRKIFENLCWTCHGLHGDGKGPAAAALPVKPADFSQHRVQGQTDGALFWKITNGRGNMASYRQVLTPTQRWQLVYFLREYKNSADAAIPGE